MRYRLIVAVDQHKDGVYKSESTRGFGRREIGEEERSVG